MEPATKEIKSIKCVCYNKQPSSTKFLDMNDDCILIILELLNLSDISSMDSTCVRLNELAGNYFGRNEYSNELIDLNFKSHQTVFNYSNKNAQKYFSRFQQIFLVHSNHRMIATNVNKRNVSANQY